VSRSFTEIIIRTIKIILFSWHHGLRWLIAAAIVWMVGMEIYERLTRKSRIKKDSGPIPAPPAYPPLVQKMLDDVKDVENP